MPIERFHDYDLTRFKTSNGVFRCDPTGRKRRREITLLPTRPDLEEQPLAVSQTHWEALEELARKHSFPLGTDDLTAAEALRLAGVLETCMAELKALRASLQAVTEMCKRKRGLRVSWRYLDN